MTTEYFADVGVDRSIDNPYFLWRLVTSPSRDYQRYDRRTRRWVSDPSLAAYLYNGEIGSRPISEEKANQIISQWSSTARRQTRLEQDKA